MYFALLAQLVWEVHWANHSKQDFYFSKIRLNMAYITVILVACLCV